MVADVLRAAKAEGASDETLVSILREHGWSERTARKELVDFYTSSTDVNLPKRSDPQSSAPLDAFLYIFSSGTLIIWVTSALMLFSTLIDQTFPDPTASYYGSGREIVSALAGLLTATPLYVGLMIILFKRLKTGATSFRSPVRLWVLSVSLLVGVGTILGFFIDYLASLLGGTQTLGDTLKLALTVLLVGGLCTFYISWLNIDRHSAGDKG